MELIHEFMQQKAVPEHYSLIKELDGIFESQGYISHEEALGSLGFDIGVIDDIIIVDKVLSIYSKHVNKLLLKMFIVSYEETTVYQLRDILKTMIQLEKSIESELIISLYREENNPLTQLIEWVKAIDETKVTLFEDYIVEVSETLIDNIFELHELRTPLDPLELDPRIPIRIEHIKRLVKDKDSATNQSLMVVRYIKKYGFKEFVTLETLSAKYGHQLRSIPVNGSTMRQIAKETLAICLLLDCKGDFSSRYRKFIEINFASPLVQSDIQSEVGKLIAEYEIKC